MSRFRIFLVEGCTEVEYRRGGGREGMRGPLMNSLGLSKQSCRWEGNSLFLPSLYLFLQYFFMRALIDQVITGNSITQINAYLFLSYQWMWHQQRWRRQWRREQWWKRRACSSMQQRRRGCGSEQRVCVWQQVAAAGGMIAMDGK